MINIPASSGTGIMRRNSSKKNSIRLSLTVILVTCIYLTLIIIGVGKFIQVIIVLSLCSIILMDNQMIEKLFTLCREVLDESKQLSNQLFLISTIVKNQQNKKYKGKQKG